MRELIEQLVEVAHEHHKTLAATYDWRKCDLGGCVRAREVLAEPSWDEAIARFTAWTTTTFPEQTEMSAYIHALKEVRELDKSFVTTGRLDPLEKIDVIMLLLISEVNAGREPRAAFLEKLAINEARQWGKPDADGVVEHIR